MHTSIELEAILSKVEKLNDSEKLTLVHKINLFLHSNKKNRSLIELKGLGTEIWKNIDIDDYMKNERR